MFFCPVSCTAWGVRNSSSSLKPGGSRWSTPMPWEMKRNWQQVKSAVPRNQTVVIKENRWSFSEQLLLCPFSEPCLACSHCRGSGCRAAAFVMFGYLWSSTSSTAQKQKENGKGEPSHHTWYKWDVRCSWLSQSQVIYNSLKFQYKNHIAAGIHVSFPYTGCHPLGNIIIKMSAVTASVRNIFRFQPISRNSEYKGGFAVCWMANWGKSCYCQEKHLNKCRGKIPCQ